MTQDINDEEEYSEAFDIKEIESELSTEVKALLEILEEDPEFEAEIDVILYILQESDMDLSYVQSHIILLIEKSLAKLDLKDKKAEEAREGFKKKKELIARRLEELSAYLMLQRSKLVTNMITGTNISADKKLFTDAKAKAHVKTILKRFAVYEIYKVTTPRRIAGETRRQNFVSNVVLRGLKVALKHEGGSLKEIKHYKGIAKEIKNFSKAIPKSPIKLARNLQKFEL